jgi:uncharacterized protein YecE (DUF72 family)
MFRIGTSGFQYQHWKEVFYPKELPQSRWLQYYSREQLRGEAEAIKKYLARGLEVFIYFNNDAHGYAIANALDLRQRVLQ